MRRLFSPLALDKDDQDDADWDFTRGWNFGTDVSKGVYEDRLQFVRSARYIDELPTQCFRIAPVPPWNSSIDHPNPWMAIPAFVENFPEEIENRRTLSPYWGGTLATERYLVGSFLDALKSTEKWIRAWYQHNDLGRAERIKSYAERGAKGQLPGSPFIKVAASTS